MASPYSSDNLDDEYKNDAPKSSEIIPRITRRRGACQVCRSRKVRCTFHILVVLGASANRCRWWCKPLFDLQGMCYIAEAHLISDILQKTGQQCRYRKPTCPEQIFLFAHTMSETRVRESEHPRNECRCSRTKFSSFSYDIQEWQANLSWYGSGSRSPFSPSPPEEEHDTLSFSWLHGSYVKLVSPLAWAAGRLPKRESISRIQPRWNKRSR